MFKLHDGHILVTFWIQLYIFRLVAIMWPKYGESLVTFWTSFGSLYGTSYSLQTGYNNMPKLVISFVIFWPLFGHFCTPIGHILDIFLVWTCFGNILVTYWSLFGLILENMSKMCPYTHSQAVPKS